MASTCGSRQPKTFLGRPETWLNSVAESGRVISMAPNFAYQTCLERVDPARLAGVDLSRWCAAMVGAEMVRPETMSGFAQRFEALGFERSSLVPCYGMAESTLAVTFDVAGQGPRWRKPPQAEPGSSQVVCVGRPIRDTELRIVAQDGKALRAREVGEIQVRGPSVFEGYHRDDRASRETLVDGWLRTGDLGYLEQGELWVTGRLKELIILRGQNVMPHELEWAVESVTGSGGTCRSGAFSVPRGGEGEVAVLAVEVDDTGPDSIAELERTVRSRVGRELSITLGEVIFVRRGRLPKTTSGKVQRHELRRRYLAGELERLSVD